MSINRQTAAGAFALAISLAVPLAAHAADAMRIVRDPLTGEMRAPNAAETLAFEKAEAQLRLGSGKAPAKSLPVEIRYPDGTVETKLGEDSMMYSVVSSDANGALTFDCLPAAEAKKFVKSKRNAAAKTTTKAGHDH